MLPCRDETANKLLQWVSDKLLEAKVLAVLAGLLLCWLSSAWLIGLAGVALAVLLLLASACSLLSKLFCRRSSQRRRDLARARFLAA